MRAVKSSAPLLLTLLALCAVAAPPGIRADGIQPGWLLARSVRVQHDVEGKDPPATKGKKVTRHFCGSGVVIAKGANAFWVLTCAHNLEHKGEMAKGKLSVTLASGKRLEAEFMHADEGADLALRQVRAGAEVLTGVKVALLAAGKTSPGAELIKCGYPGFKRVVGRGELLSGYGTRTVAKKEYQMVLTDIHSSPGDSGAGVFRTKDKRLIGLIHGGGHDPVLKVRVASVGGIKVLREFLAGCAKDVEGFAFEGGE